MNIPLFIYLDQNKWIDLAKSVHSRPGGDSFNQVRDLIFKKVNNGEWAFPLSFIHFSETMSRLEEESRKRLSEVMSKTSNNYSILPFMHIEMLEVAKIFYELHGRQFPNLNSIIISQDLFKCVGLKTDDIQITTTTKIQNFDEIICNFYQEVVKSPEMFYKLMSINSYKDIVTSMYADELEEKISIEKERERIKRIPEQHRYLTIVIEYFTLVLDLIQPILLKSLGLKDSELFPQEILNNREKMLEFLEASPTINTKLKITYQILRDLNRPIDKNDGKDISFLSTAVPYCDVVITEKSWQHIIKSEKLDQKYSTRIYKNLNELLHHE